MRALVVSTMALMGAAASFAATDPADMLLLFPDHYADAIQTMVDEGLAVGYPIGTLTSTTAT